MKQVFVRVGVLGFAWLTPSLAAPTHQPEEGDFVDAFVTEQFSYDDNLFRLPSGSQYLAEFVGPGASRQDRINAVLAGVEGQWTLGRQAIAFDAHAGDNRYEQNTVLNNTSVTGNVDWDWRAGERWTGQAGVIFNRALANFQNTFFYGRDIVNTSQYFGNATFELGPHWNVFGGFDYTTATQSADVEKLNDFRSKAGNVGARYVAASDKTFGLNYEYTTGTYPHGASVAFNGLPFNRDYDASIVRFLASIPVGAKALFDANIGYEKRKYPFSSVGSFSGNVWRGTLTWQLLPKTEVILNTWRQITAYLDAESLYFISTGYSAAPTWMPTEKLKVALTASTEKQNYLGPGSGLADYFARHDRLSTELLGATYSPRHYLVLKLSCGLQQRSSDVTQFQYHDRILTASITGKFP